MATAIKAAATKAEPYCLPELLSDIRLLDLLELSGSTVQASQFLSLSQPTVSRRYRSLAQDFDLERNLRQHWRCRYGTSETMRWLRLGCRAHRLAAGFARIGTDLLHAPLLAGIKGLLPTPVRYRSIHTWAALVRDGVVDAALVSGLEILAARSQLDWSELQWLELGAMPLALARPPGELVAVTDLPPVLVPPRALAPGLHRALRHQGLVLRTAGNSCTTAEQWECKAAMQGWAIPVVRHLDGWHEQSLPIAMEASIGVLLPAERATATQLHLLLEAPRRTISASCTALSQEERADSALQR
jgi:hypothetical protein